MGRPYGVGTLAATAALMSTNLLFSRQPGNANNDVVSLALLLAAAAILVEAARRGNTGIEALIRRRPPGPERGPRGRLAHGGTVVAGLAAGLALGTKLTVVVPVGALTIGVVALARAGTRLPTAAWWGGGLALGGGYWYLRN